MANILVVDDVGVIRLKLKSILKSENFTVFEAATIQAVKNNLFSREISLKDIDLILLDIYLKSESGFVLLEYLGKNYPDIKVSMVTVEAKREMIKKAINLGAKDYIIKPFDKNKLLDKVYALLEDNAVKSKDNSLEKKDFQDDMILFKRNLALEINRSLRSELPFSLLYVNFLEKINEKKLFKVKEKITGKIRDIDQLYSVSDSEYLFLLPLTDQEGSQVFTERIMPEVKGENNLKNDQIKVLTLTFPEIVLGKKEEKLVFAKEAQYKKTILQSLPL